MTSNDSTYAISATRDCGSPREAAERAINVSIALGGEIVQIISASAWIDAVSGVLDEECESCRGGIHRGVDVDGRAWAVEVTL